MEILDADRVYYAVDSGSLVAKAIQQSIDKKRSFIAAMKSLEAELGDVNIIAYEFHSFAGAQFKGEIPKGWRKKKHYAVPDKRTRDGRALAKRLEGIKGSDCWDFAKILNRATGKDVTYWGEGKVMLPGFSMCGETFVLSMPAKCNADFDGCRKLKMSEYWAMKEAAKTEAFAG